MTVEADGWKEKKCGTDIRNLLYPVQNSAEDRQPVQVRLISTDSCYARRNHHRIYTHVHVYTCYI